MFPTRLTGGGAEGGSSPPPGADGCSSPHRSRSGEVWDNPTAARSRGFAVHSIDDQLRGGMDATIPSGVTGPVDTDEVTGSAPKHLRTSQRRCPEAPMPSGGRLETSLGRGLGPRKRYGESDVHKGVLKWSAVVDPGSPAEKFSGELAVMKGRRRPRWIGHNFPVPFGSKSKL